MYRIVDQVSYLKSIACSSTIQHKQREFYLSLQRFTSQTTKFYLILKRFRIGHIKNEMFFFENLTSKILTSIVRLSMLMTWNKINRDVFIYFRTMPFNVFFIEKD